MDSFLYEQQGRNAAHGAVRRNQCPYEKGRKRKLWLKGWDLQMKELRG